MDISKQLSVDLTRFDPLVSAMELNGVSTMDLIIQNNLSSLSKRLHRSIKEIEEFVNIIEGYTIDPSPVTRHTKQHIKTGIRSLDDSGFEIPLGEVTEVFGQSGSGKSHFLYQISCLSQLTPNKKKVIFINTEGFLETKRLLQVMDGFKNESISLDNIEYIYCQDLEILDHILFTQLPIKLQQSAGDVGCLIIDSIGHHLRKEESVTSTSFLKALVQDQYEQNDTLLSSKSRFDSQFNTYFKTNDQYDLRVNKKFYIIKLYKHLVSLARKFGMAVVISNQITDQVNSNDDKMDLDYQIGWMSGWDNRATYNHQCRLTESIKRRRPHYGGERENSTSRTPNSQDNVTESHRVSLMASTNNQYSRYEEEEELEQQYNDYMKTFDRTKYHVPSLGYHWAKFIDNRILLLKSYKPVVTSAPGQKRKLDDFSGWEPVRALKVVPGQQKFKFVLSAEGLR